MSELSAPHEMSLAAASKHIRTLEEAGLIHRTVEGRVHRCRIEPGPLMGIGRWLRRYDKFWSHRLDALERALKE